MTDVVHRPGNPAVIQDFATSVAQVASVVAETAVVIAGVAAALAQAAADIANTPAATSAAKFAENAIAQAAAVRSSALKVLVGSGDDHARSTRAAGTTVRVITG